MTDVEGFILIGGKSSRMGTDKAGLVLGAESFTEKIAAALSSITDVVRVVGAKETRGGVWASVMDVYKEWGALGGLHAALDACRSPWAAVVACDLPFVTGELLARLASLRAGGLDAVIPVQEEGRPQPLCALYRARACLAAVEAMIRADELRPRLLLSRVRSRAVAFEELSSLRGSALFFSNVNTRGDYARALDAARARAEGPEEVE